MMSRRSAIFRVASGRVGANQRLPTLSDFSFRLDQIDGRRIAGLHARPVLPRELLRDVERSLLHGHVRGRGLQRPVGLLDGGDGLDGGFAELELGALLILLGDEVLVSRGVDRAVLQQRLRERDLKARLQAGIEAAEGRCRLQSGMRPTRRSTCLSPRAAAGGRRSTRTNRRRRCASSPASRFDAGVTTLDRASHAREDRDKGALRLGDLRRPDFRVEPDDRESGLFSTARRTASSSVSSSVLVVGETTCAEELPVSTAPMAAETTMVLVSLKFIAFRL